MGTVRSLSYGRLSAVGPCQQSVETVVCTGVISLVVDVPIVDAGAGERSLVHKQGAVTSVIPGLTRY